MDVPEWKSQGSIVVLSSDVLRDDNEEELSTKQRERRQQEKEREYWKEFTDLYQEEGERALREKASAIRDRVEKTKDHLESLQDRLQDAKARENDELLTGLRQSRRDTREHLQFLHLRASVCEGVLWEIDRYGAPQWMKARGDSQQSTAGRPSRLEKPEEVLETLNSVCDWLDQDPRPVFKGDGGLVDFATNRFPHLTVSGTRDRIRETFRQLRRKHEDLPTPDLDTGTDGHEYVDNEAQIRALRDAYKARFVEK
jgi:hypothetical protein